MESMCRKVEAKSRRKPTKTCGTIKKNAENQRDTAAHVRPKVKADASLLACGEKVT